MDVFVELTLFTDYSFKNELEEFFWKFGISLDFPDKPKYGSDVFLNVSIKINEPNKTELISRIISELKRNYQISASEAIMFKFDSSDFENSPIFELESTGNSPKAHLDHKNFGIEWKTLCHACGLQEKVQTSPLVMDTSKIGNQYMVNVGTDYWVVSEKMARLMEEWKLTGYELREVIHSGKKEGQPAYQVIPTNILPPWSSEMKHYYFVCEPEDRCPVCNLKGRIDFPYHYIKIDLEQNPIKDINIMRELKSAGRWAYRPVFISKRFRDLLIENGITREVLHMYDDNYGSQDWLFRPVIIVEGTG